MARGRKKRRSAGLRVAAILMVVVIALLALFAVFFATHRESSFANRTTQFFQSFFGSKNKTAFEEEAEKIIRLNPYEGELDAGLHTTGTFDKIEGAMKEYCTRYIQALREVRALLSDEDYRQLMTIDNLQADAPTYTNSLALLDSLQETAESDVQLLKGMKEERAVMEQVEELQLNNYFTDLYRETVYGGIAARWMYSDAELDDALQSLTTSIGQRRSVLTFLRDNAENWEVNEGKLAFRDEELLAKYNELIAALG